MATDGRETEVYATEVLTSPQDFIDVPKAEIVTDTSVANSDPGAVEGDGFLSKLQQDVRFQGAFAVTKAMCQNAAKYNPLQGISSSSQLTSRIKREGLACVNPREYTKPQSREEWTTRLRSNVSFFRVSYGTTVVFFLFYFLLTSPFLLMELLTVTGLWTYFFQIKGADEVVTIGQYNLGRKEKLLVMVPLTAFVCVFGGLLSYFIWVAFVSAFFIGAHASFRNQIEPNPLDELADMENV
uniref:PRA1 family protein n=1 Tax=Aplanochytrium stocchinoi TaxID=215587 RepID=A0A6S8BEA2_9STRA|mmetsp:Transcript_8397/g.10613  ORF Transcript_8397/g.10613 Transcript_8397/m.10613 type:complete len:240 (-) Transcript_8397:960-1679(-)|eukprot:CAMPEP_0204822958 /NCGR_PEP_ID=MMETSP1346-20131115/1138_1 /ASSEMBLY_ACC=CAM_ASM_000771 /TAXON_ID=215587 /ORGANISM="Aplanochytrium stocchinoi, Strain GSBS06" /LENGTH=239 /DNA_ID=CAMNT_0051949461 /DNA_START=196 /DNA_END=915 /DNA_ORIENTATION=+